MQLRAFSLVVLALAGCGGKYKPDGPVMGDYERSFKYPVHRPHEGLVYSGKDPAISAPVVPLLAFGAAFDLDLAVMPREGDFEMLEFARMALPDRAVWLALETKRDSGDQTVLANVDDLETLMPEIPIYRQEVNLQADDRSTEFTVDVALTYQNSRGESVQAQFTGDPPTKTAKKRNGKTWDHGQNQVLALIDVPAAESLFKANVEVDGKSIGFKKMGLTPSQYALQQVQGGLATGAFRVVPEMPAAGGMDYGTVMWSAPGGAKPDTVAQEPSIAVRMAIVQNLSAIEKCYELRLRDNPAIAGSMQFDWQIEAGAVTGAAMVANTSPDAITDQALGDCVVASIQAWQLDPSVSGTVSWPFQFAPGDELSEPTVTLGDGKITLAEAAAPTETLGDEDLGIHGERQTPEDMLGEEGAAAAPAEGPMMVPISSFKTVHTMPSGNTVELKWLVFQQGDRVTARQTTDLRTLEYNYRLVQGAYLELVSITVEQYGRATPVTAITFNPPLPDLRWPFNGRRVSSFVIDVNGQQNYAFGDVESYWTESGPKVKVAPSAPAWAVDRPLLSSINFIDGAALVKIERTGE